MLEFTESRRVPRTSAADGDKFREVMANDVKLALKVIFKTIQQLKIGEEGRSPFSNNPTMLSNKKDVAFV